MSDVSHTEHPNSHTHGLADGCPRCSEHAAEPFLGLDEENIRNLIERTLRDRFGGGDGPGGHVESPFGEYEHARSKNEALAMGAVMTRLEHVGQTFQAAPDLVALYLRERWRIPVEVK